MEIRLNISGRDKNEDYIVFSDEPISLTDAMSLAGLNFYRPCGGFGRCMRCGVRFLYGATEVTEKDDRAFGFTDLRGGWRLGCDCVITKDCRIEIPSSLVGEIKSNSIESVFGNVVENEHELAAAVDIGTTTVAVAIVDRDTNEVVSSTSASNSQIKYGSDVMTRIDSAINNPSAVADMLNLVKKDVYGAAGKLSSDFTNIKDIAIAGNTTMEHIANGYPVDGLASYPFKPYNLDGVSTERSGRDFYTMPCISAFVGGDIVAGIYALDIIKSTEKSLFVDLGTNAEIVLWDGEKLWCTSASAGPALEGGNISCGVASVKGAIDHVKINEDGTPNVSTISGEEPLGICGSGIIDAVYELRKAEIIDNGGLFIDKYSEKGFEFAKGVVLTPEDVQNVLLAKSAVLSGIKVLLKEADVDISSIDHLYVAGGLGASINVNSAIGLGLLPMELKDKLEAVGNTSLKGAVKYLLSKDNKELETIKKVAKVIELGNSKSFEAEFLNNIYLPF